MRPTDAAAQSCAVVVIGRNEGERLQHCLRSIGGDPARTVYVDSGSTDSSVAFAQSMGVDVVRLDMSTAFTAARARNAGFARSRQSTPGAAYVQFIDGDCEMIDGWMDGAQAFLAQHRDVAVVCGRLRERHPERSIYNRLCDMEWDRPAGQARACGGIAMYRADVFEAQGGFRESLIAGEEPELCVRIRAQGWKVWRLDQAMAWHDAAMFRFRQWWLRAKRSGYAAAEGAWLHGAPPERHGVAQTRRALAWGLLLPLAIVGMALLHPAWLALLLAYPMQAVRLAWRDGITDANRRLQAMFYVMARFPEAQGAIAFWLDQLRRRRSELIEYK